MGVELALREETARAVCFCGGGSRDADCGIGSGRGNGVELDKVTVSAIAGFSRVHE